jgi:hypothetical protein
LRMQWSSLQVGDEVLVHDPRTTDMALLAGVVAMLQTLNGSIDIGIRVVSDGGTTVMLRPARLATHLVPLDTTEQCWRCDPLAAA